MNDGAESAERKRLAMESFLARQDRELAEAKPTMTPVLPPAGWYPHPTMADTRRYWDGAAWTDHIAPGAAATSTPSVVRSGDGEQEKRDQGLVAAGFVMMVIFPIGGFIAGAILLGRRASTGVVIMLLSVVSAYVWYDLAFAPDPLDCYSENVDRAMAGLPALDCD